MRNTITKKIVCSIVACLFFVNDLYAMSPIVTSSALGRESRSGTIDGMYALGKKLFAAKRGPGSIDFDKIVPFSFKPERPPVVEWTEFVKTDYRNPPAEWGDNPLLKETSLLKAFEYFRDNEAKIPSSILKIMIGRFEVKEGELPIARIEDGSGGYTLVIHEDFERMWNSIRANDVWFKHAFPDDEVRTLSVAWGIFYRVAKHEMGDLAQKNLVPKSEGHINYSEIYSPNKDVPALHVLGKDQELRVNMINGRYNIANDAIWAWFLGSYCFADTTRYDNDVLKDRINWFFEGREARAMHLNFEFPSLLSNDRVRERAIKLALGINYHYFAKGAEAVKVRKDELTPQEEKIDEFATIIAGYLVDTGADLTSTESYGRSLRPTSVIREVGHRLSDYIDKAIGYLILQMGWSPSASDLDSITIRTDQLQAARIVTEIPHLLDRQLRLIAIDAVLDSIRDDKSLISRKINGLKPRLAVPLPGTMIEEKIDFNENNRIRHDVLKRAFGDTELFFQSGDRFVKKVFERASSIKREKELEERKGQIKDTLYATGGGGDWRPDNPAEMSFEDGIQQEGPDWVTTFDKGKLRVKVAVRNPQAFRNDYRIVLNAIREYLNGKNLAEFLAGARTEDRRIKIGESTYIVIKEKTDTGARFGLMKEGLQDTAGGLNYDVIGVIEQIGSEPAPAKSASSQSVAGQSVNSELSNTELREYAAASTTTYIGGEPPYVPEGIGDWETREEFELIHAAGKAEHAIRYIEERITPEGRDYFIEKLRGYFVDPKELAKFDSWAAGEGQPESGGIGSEENAEQPVQAAAETQKTGATQGIYDAKCREFLLTSPRSPLTEQEKVILEKRFGPDPLTLAKIGAMVGHDKEWIRQLERRVIRKAQYTYETQMYEPINLDLLDTEPVGRLAYFSRKVWHAFDKLGIISIGDLIKRSGDELLEVKYFGATSLGEVLEALQKSGLELRYATVAEAPADVATSEKTQGAAPVKAKSDDPIGLLKSLSAVYLVERSKPAFRGGKADGEAAMKKLADLCAKLINTEEGRKLLVSGSYSKISPNIRINLAIDFGMPVMGTRVTDNREKIAILERLYNEAAPASIGVDHRMARPEGGYKPDNYDVAIINGEDAYLIIDRVMRFGAYIINTEEGKGRLIAYFDNISPEIPIGLADLAKISGRNSGAGTSQLPGSKEKLPSVPLRSMRDAGDPLTGIAEQLPRTFAKSGVTRANMSDEFRPTDVPAQAAAEEKTRPTVSIDDIAGSGAALIWNKIERQKESPNPVSKVVIPVWITFKTADKYSVVVNGTKVEFETAGLTSKEVVMNRILEQLSGITIPVLIGRSVDSYHFGPVEFKNEGGNLEAGLYVDVRNSEAGEVAQGQEAPDYIKLLEESGRGVVERYRFEYSDVGVNAIAGAILGKVSVEELAKSMKIDIGLARTIRDNAAKSYNRAVEIAAAKAKAAAEEKAQLLGAFREAMRKNYISEEEILPICERVIAQTGRYKEHGPDAVRSVLQAAIPLAQAGVNPKGFLEKIEIFILEGNGTYHNLTFFVDGAKKGSMTLHDEAQAAVGEKPQAAEDQPKSGGLGQDLIEKYAREGNVPMLVADIAGCPASLRPDEMRMILSALQRSNPGKVEEFNEALVRENPRATTRSTATNELAQGPVAQDAQLALGKELMQIGLIRMQQGESIHDKRLWHELKDILDRVNVLYSSIYDCLSSSGTVPLSSEADIGEGDIIVTTLKPEHLVSPVDYFEIVISKGEAGNMEVVSLENGWFNSMKTNHRLFVRNGARVVRPENAPRILQFVQSARDLLADMQSLRSEIAELDMPPQGKVGSPQTAVMPGLGSPTDIVGADSAAEQPRSVGLSENQIIECAQSGNIDMLVANVQESPEVLRADTIRMTRISLETFNRANLSEFGTALALSQAAAAEAAKESSVSVTETSRGVQEGSFVGPFYEGVVITGNAGNPIAVYFPGSSPSSMIKVEAPAGVTAYLEEDYNDAGRRAQIDNKRGDGARSFRFGKPTGGIRVVIVDGNKVYRVNVSDPHLSPAANRLMVVSMPAGTPRQNYENWSGNPLRKKNVRIAQAATEAKKPETPEARDSATGIAVQPEDTPEFWQERRAARKELHNDPFIKDIATFKVQTGKGVGPGAVMPLANAEVLSIWQTINLLHAEGVEALVPQEDMALTENMDKTLEKINRNAGHDVIGCKPFSTSDEERFIQMLSHEPEGGKKRIIITIGQRSVDFVNTLAAKNPSLFKRVRTINVALPEGYSGMKPAEKTFYQASMLMKAIYARLYERDRDGIVGLILKSLLKGCIDGTYDDFLNGLVETNDETDAATTKRFVDCSKNTIKLLSEVVAEAIGRLKLEMKEFWTAA